MNTDLLQRRVEEALARAVGEGGETGLQAAAYRDGELVVDAWAGLADPGTGRAVDSRSLFHVFSCGKAVTATAVHLLAQAGRLDYDSPVARYWPDFGVPGKESVTVRHVLTHTSGVARLPGTTTLGELCDWERMCRVLCGLDPLWPPGGATGYHGLTFGWILGEVVRGADGRHLQDLVAQDVLDPLGLRDSMALGRLSDSMSARSVVHLDDGVVPEPAPLDVPADESPCAAWANHPAYLDACVPATATATAEGLARLFASLVGGVGRQRVPLLSPDRLAAATSLAVDAVDLFSGSRVRRGLGYLLGRLRLPADDDVAVFGHHGLGGSLVFAAPAHRFSFALTKNNLTGHAFAGSTADLVVRAMGMEVDFLLP
ncbi:serine hydrolase domain-containing protein [Kitasatospora phosalacinea]|uniref:serine hydrolase domain-containing protein n=1 Tax=Kitasatospora phosalacinea TaxID=2065 RepID=UPI00364C7F35